MHCIPIFLWITSRLPLDNKVTCPCTRNSHMCTLYCYLFSNRHKFYIWFVFSILQNTNNHVNDSLNILPITTTSKQDVYTPFHLFWSFLKISNLCDTKQQSVAEFVRRLHVGWHGITFSLNLGISLALHHTFEFDQPPYLKCIRKVFCFISISHTYPVPIDKIMFHTQALR